MNVSVNICDYAHVWFVGFGCAVEYTPQAYLQSDLQMFAKNYSTDLIGKEPYLVSIDGGKTLFCGLRRHVLTLK